jgi:hypothetical protein
MEYLILRQQTWIFKVEAASDKQAVEEAKKIWDDDLNQSSDLIYHEGTDKVINEDPLPSIYRKDNTLLPRHVRERFDREGWPEPKPEEENEVARILRTSGG